MGLNFKKAIADVEAAAAEYESLADGQGFILQELAGEERRVLLGGPDSPERGVEIAGELRSQVTWYPGASAASTQILGTREEPIVLTGRLRDGWWGYNGWAAAKAQSLRDLWLGQRYCELSWGTLVVRRGYIKRVAIAWETEHDAVYTVEFQVSESDEAVVAVSDAGEVNLTKTFELSDLLDLLGDALELLNTAANVSNAAQAVL